MILLSIPDPEIPAVAAALACAPACASVLAQLERRRREDTLLPTPPPQVVVIDYDTPSWVTYYLYGAQADQLRQAVRTARQCPE